MPRKCAGCGTPSPRAGHRATPTRPRRRKSTDDQGGHGVLRGDAQLFGCAFRGIARLQKAEVQALGSQRSAAGFRGGLPRDIPGAAGNRVATAVNFLNLPLFVRRRSHRRPTTIFHDWDEMRSWKNDDLYDTTFFFFSFRRV